MRRTTEAAGTTQITLARWLREGVGTHEATETDDERVLVANDDYHDVNNWVANPIGLLLIGKFGSAEAANMAHRHTGSGNLESACEILGITEEFAQEIIQRQKKGIPMERIVKQLEGEEL